jgi:hypothetical protein
MSLSDFRRPFDIAKHPTLEPEVKRAILASWASDAAAVENRPALRSPPRNGPPVPIDPVSIDEVMDALKVLDAREGH